MHILELCNGDWFSFFLENWNNCKNWKLVTCYIKTFMFTTLYCPNVSRSFTLQLRDNGLFAFNCIPWLCDCCSAGDLVSFSDILVNNKFYSLPILTMAQCQLGWRSLTRPWTCDLANLRTLVNPDVNWQLSAYNVHVYVYRYNKLDINRVLTMSHSVSGGGGHQPGPGSGWPWQPAHVPS